MEFVLLAVLVCMGVALLLLHGLRKKQQRQRELVRRLRSSGMYAGIYALFCQCNERHVERMELRPEGITVMFLIPRGDTVRYVFDEHGIDPVGPEMLGAMAQAASVDVPCLRDTLYYGYEEHAIPLPGGGRERWYAYEMKEKRKDYLLQAIQEKNRSMNH